MNAHDADSRQEPSIAISGCVKTPPGTKHEGSSSHWVMGLTLAGACDIGQPGGKRFLLERGDLVVTRPNTPQRWQVVGKTDWQTIYCLFDPRPHWIAWLSRNEIAPGFMKRILRNSRVLREVRDGMLRAYRLGSTGLPDVQDIAYNAIERVLLSVNRYFQCAGHSENDPRVGKAIRYLAENLSTPLSLQEVAAHSNLSRARLAYLFKKQVGLGPIAFQQQQRIARAKQMLQLPILSVKQIAAELGFKSPKYFSSCFRKMAGVSPRQYRRSN
jgi:AraC family transcriptional regulator, arabinose operon regulatory protein